MIAVEFNAATNTTKGNRMKSVKLYGGKTWNELSESEKANQRSIRAMGKGIVGNAETVESSNTLQSAITNANYPTNLDAWNPTQIKRVLSKSDWHGFQIILNMIKHDTKGRFTLETVEYQSGYFTKKGGKTAQNIVVPDRLQYAPKRVHYTIKFDDKSSIKIVVVVEYGTFEIIQSSGNPIKRYIKR